MSPLEGEVTAALSAGGALEVANATGTRLYGIVGDPIVQVRSPEMFTAAFRARGLDAVNLGPGATRYAHAVDERVEIAELEQTFAALQRFLLTP